MGYGSSPGMNLIRSAVALARHALGLALCCWRASAVPAAAIAAHTDFFSPSSGPAAGA